MSGTARAGGHPSAAAWLRVCNTKWWHRVRNAGPCPHHSSAHRVHRPEEAHTGTPEHTQSRSTIRLTHCCHSARPRALAHLPTRPPLTFFASNRRGPPACRADDVRGLPRRRYGAAICLHAGVAALFGRHDTACASPLTSGGTGGGAVGCYNDALPQGLPGCLVF